MKPEATVTYNGEDCVYEGPDTMTSGLVDFTYVNETEREVILGWWLLGDDVEYFSIGLSGLLDRSSVLVSPGEKWGTYHEESFTVIRVAHRDGHLRRMRRLSFCPQCPHCRPDAAPDMSPLTE